MSVKQSDYEILLAEYSNRISVIPLLKQHRPYLEMIPSMRRASESVITIPLPVARIRYQKQTNNNNLATTTYSQAQILPCDIAILMCDPEWKIKLGVEIMIFIHQPDEDLSHFLYRWRKTQVLLAQDYEWLMPTGDEHMLSEGGAEIYPFFVLFENSPERIKKGLQGACLPFVVQTPELFKQEEKLELTIDN
jgi:hypothetical protein